MDLNRILYFVNVIEYGNYTKAAERLGVPKSTLSRNVQALEDELKLRLLHRSTRKINLTKAGEKFYQECLPLITQLQNARTKALDYQQDVSGQLRVTMPAEMGSSFLAQILPEFIERFPKIQLEIDFSTSNHNLIEAGFDLALRIGSELEDSSYIAKRIATPHLGLFASPQYLKTHPALETIEDLHQHQHILMNIHKGELYLENREPINRKNYQLSTNSMAFNKSMCLQGLGIAVLPLILCQKELQNGNLVQVLAEYPLLRPHIYAVYPSRIHPSKALTTFIDFVSQEIAKLDILG